MDSRATSALRAEAEYDVFLAGPLFMDIIFAGMPHAPVLGTETWAESMGCCPGGIANMAIALSRLGMATSLATVFGDDDYGDFCRESLEQVESVDIGPSVRKVGAHTPVTVSLAYDGERTMVSHGHVSKVGRADPVRLPSMDAVFASIEPEAGVPWLKEAHDAGARVVVDTGWDASGAWDLSLLPDLRYADVFVPNAAEAMAYTRTDTPLAAARALTEHVELAVVTCGADGAVAVDRSGEVETAPALTIPATDSTGAGDIFVAGLMTGLAHDGRLRQSLNLGCVAAGLSVQWMGGSFSAPTMSEIGQWYLTHPKKGSEGFEAEYGFIDTLRPRTGRTRPPRRAIPTVGFRPNTTGAS